MHSMYLQYLASTHTALSTCENGKRAKSHICGNFEIVWGWRSGEFERKEETTQETPYNWPLPFLLKFRRVSYGSTKFMKSQLRCKSSTISFFFQVCFVTSSDIKSKTTCSMGGLKCDLASFLRRMIDHVFECQFKWGITFELKQMIYS